MEERVRHAPHVTVGRVGGDSSAGASSARSKKASGGAHGKAYRPASASKAAALKGARKGASSSWSPIAAIEAQFAQTAASPVAAAARGGGGIGNGAAAAHARVVRMRAQGTAGSVRRGFMDPQEVRDDFAWDPASAPSTPHVTGYRARDMTARVCSGGAARVSVPSPRTYPNTSGQANGAARVPTAGVPVAHVLSRVRHVLRSNNDTVALTDGRAVHVDTLLGACIAAIARMPRTSQPALDSDALRQGDFSQEGSREQTAASTSSTTTSRDGVVHVVPSMMEQPPPPAAVAQSASARRCDWVGPPVRATPSTLYYAAFTRGDTVHRAGECAYLSGADGIRELVQIEACAEDTANNERFLLVRSLVRADNLPVDWARWRKPQPREVFLLHPRLDRHRSVRVSGFADAREDVGDAGDDVDENGDGAQGSVPADRLRVVHPSNVVGKAAALAEPMYTEALECLLRAKPDGKSGGDLDDDVPGVPRGVAAADVHLLEWEFVGLKPGSALSTSFRRVVPPASGDDEAGTEVLDGSLAELERVINAQHRRLVASGVLHA
ncbi:hypothetical protein NFJ02_22g48180 [Pycnococcus provasolii]